jgi:mono/diheme cytochrome c family protein
MESVGIPLELDRSRARDGDRVTGASTPKVFAWSAALGAVITAVVAPGPIAAKVFLDPAGGFSHPATVKELPPGEGRSLLERRCGTCHALGLVMQQRLAAEAWANEVKKMRGWGAFLSDEEAVAVTGLLATNLGLDTQRYVPARLDPREAEVPTRAEKKVPGPRGDSAKGAELFKVNCAPCHGEAAEGARGPALRGRPITTQPQRFASALREGRGDMPGYPTFDAAAVADLFAFIGAP